MMEHSMGAGMDLPNSEKIYLTSEMPITPKTIKDEKRIRTSSP
jgi:hypothetical protein